MKLILPDNTQEFVQSHLTQGLKRGNSNYSGAHNILLAVPQLANDPVTRKLLERTLLDPAIGYRQHAARILVALGDPKGLLHLTYNSLRTHPILGQDNTRFSGWYEAALRYADRLDPTCIDLLASEMKSAARGFDGVTLALAGVQLDPGEINRDHAAFQAAWKGDSAASDVLVDWLATTWESRAVAAWGIVRSVRSDEGARRVTELANPAHPLYDESRDSRIAPLLRHLMLPLMAFARTIVQGGGPNPFASAVLQCCLRDFDGSPVGGSTIAAEILSNEDLGRRFISASPTVGPIFPPALMATFQDLFADDAVLLENLQIIAIRRFIEERGPFESQPGLRPQFLPMWAVPPGGTDFLDKHFYNLKGFEVQVDEGDLIVHGAEWLRKPLRYAAGIH